MANINQDQRESLLKIIESNGRALEFYEKFGKDRVTKHKVRAEGLLAKITANDTLEEKMKARHQVEEKDLNGRQKKESDIIDKVDRNLKAELEKLGYSTSNDWVDGEYRTILREDTSITQSEYEMFKKRAIKNVTCAPTLEEADKAITAYLDLVK